MSVCNTISSLYRSGLSSQHIHVFCAKMSNNEVFPGFPCRCYDTGAFQYISVCTHYRKTRLSYLLSYSFPSLDSAFPVFSFFISSPSISSPSTQFLICLLTLSQLLPNFSNKLPPYFCTVVFKFSEIYLSANQNTPRLFTLSKRCAVCFTFSPRWVGSLATVSSGISVTFHPEMQQTLEPVTFNLPIAVNVCVFLKL